jgi:hypothetical protein
MPTGAKAKYSSSTMRIPRMEAHELQTLDDLLAGTEEASAVQ